MPEKTIDRENRKKGWVRHNGAMDCSTVEIDQHDRERKRGKRDSRRGSSDIQFPVVVVVVDATFC